MTQPDSSRLPPRVLALARAFAAEGGRLFVVGGWVRDAVQGRPAKDLDLEVFGLPPERIESIVAPDGFTPPVGRNFPVWRHTDDGIDVARPRVEDEDEADPTAAFARAAIGRDLRINAMAFDPLDGTVLDPLGGREDLATGTMRCADPRTFGEDPLRILRVARLAAALGMEPDAELVEICRSLDPSAIPVERLASELDRILLELPRPWRAIEWLDRMGQLDVFPPLAVLRGVPQDPEWHPEGDVYVHTGMVVDRAARIAREEALEGEPRAVLLWSALCHDLGKPATTEIGEDGHVRSYAHDEESAAIARAWLASLRLGSRRVDAVASLVRHHLAPALYVKNGAKRRGYRRLARKLEAGGVTPVDLERLARADHLGRTTPDALADRFHEGEIFLAAARDAFVERGPRPDVVRAATFMRRGIEAGPTLGRLLARARELQDETGLQDEAALVERVLAEHSD